MEGEMSVHHLDIKIQLKGILFFECFSLSFEDEETLFIIKDIQFSIFIENI